MKTAWLFPGQGAQKTGMGHDLAKTSEAARRVFEQADRALGFPLSELCFSGPDEDLMLTANTQPAIVATSCAVLAALKERYPNLPNPAFAAGHSLGEYSALVAAGTLSLTDAVQLVRLRGQAMQDAVAPGDGAMLAVIGGDPAAVQALCDAARGAESLSPANFNSPGQIVIAGHKSAVDRALALTKEYGLKGIPLKVSAPFHCSLMAPAAERVKTALMDVTLSELSFPVISNVLAEPNSDAAEVPGLLVRQICGAVQWERTLRVLAAAGVTHALEIGPGKVLAGLVKKTQPDITVLSVSDPESLEQVEAFLA
ncbi:MAG: hypothetical protein RJA70_3264 [Pseudomonadota bacterium]|jgi:[acyl-carrier-protein] S-malonyltransferase